MNKEIAAKIAFLRRANLNWPETLCPLPRSLWPADVLEGRATRIGVMRSRSFLVQVFKEHDGLRLSIMRTMIDQHGEWVQKITWDELQQVKREAGFGDQAFVEVYPADSNIINVANMRHLWLLPCGFKIGWMNEPNLFEVQR